MHAAQALENAYAGSTGRGAARRVEQYRATRLALEKALGDINGANTIVEASRRLATNSTDAAVNRFSKWAATAVGYKVAGPLGGTIARAMFRGASEVGYKRNVLWRAQNMYARFKGRTADSLLRFVENPKPRPAHVPTSRQEYEAAIDAIKRSAGMPTSYNTPDPHASVKPFEATWVEPHQAQISAPLHMQDISRRMGLEYGPIEPTVLDLPLASRGAKVRASQPAPIPADSPVSSDIPTIPPPSRRASESSVVPSRATELQSSKQAKAIDDYMKSYNTESLSERMPESEARKYITRAIEILGHRQPTTKNIEHALMTARLESMPRDVTMPPISSP